MNITERKMPWWYFILIGVIAIAASIFFLADRLTGLEVLSWLVFVGSLGFGIYNLAAALKNKDDKRVFIPLLVQGIIGLVLALLIAVIAHTEELLGIIIACWLIAFGVFEVIFGRQGDNPKRTRLGSILVIIGLVLLVIPLVFGIDYVLLIAIIGLIIGVFCVALGIIIKTKHDKRTSGGRSNLI